MTTELAPEDALRLNVLLANKPVAIRIDESRMILYGLTLSGESSIKLNATCRDDAYLKKIRELLSEYALGTPAGYPLHLQRWARMGQVKIENLDALLCLGECEAVIAVVYSSDLSEILASRAWWAMQDADNARELLHSQQVLISELGKQLADYLVEFLPFETEPDAMMLSIQQVLQKNLIDDAVRQRLWNSARRKQTLYVGFLAAGARAIPEKKGAHLLFDMHVSELQQAALEGDEVASVMQYILSADGQTWLDTLLKILEKPGNQEMLNRTMNVVREHLVSLRPEETIDMTLDELTVEATCWAKDQSVLLQQMTPQLQALRILSGLSYGVLRPVFLKTDAMGSLMRKKIAPVTDQLKEIVAVLLLIPPTVQNARM